MAFCTFTPEHGLQTWPAYEESSELGRIQGRSQASSHHGQRAGRCWLTNPQHSRDSCRGREHGQRRPGGFCLRGYNLLGKWQSTK